MQCGSHTMRPKGFEGNKMKRRELLKALPVAAVAPLVSVSGESSNPIPAARKAFREAFAADPYFRNTYVANIACAIYDTLNVPANQPTPNLASMGGADYMADKIVRLIFES